MSFSLLHAVRLLQRFFLVLWTVAYFPLYCHLFSFVFFLPFPLALRHYILQGGISQPAWWYSVGRFNWQQPTFMWQRPVRPRTAFSIVRGGLFKPALPTHLPGQKVSNASWKPRFQQRFPLQAVLVYPPRSLHNTDLGIIQCTGTTV